MEAIIILLLIFANGLFAMAEIAVVSSNEIRLEQRAAAGSRGARRALELSRNPNRFLATVQIGITLVGVFAGAFGGATLAAPLSDVLQRLAWLAPYADPVAFVLVVVAITYLSLVIGELVPKRVALNDPERTAAALATGMHWVSVVATPFVRFLSGSTELVIRLLRVRPPQDEAISEEEIDIVIARGRRAGVIEPAEHDIIENAFWLGERRVNDIMTPRHEVRWLDLRADSDGWLETIRARPHSRYLVCDGDLDQVVGFAVASELLAAGLGRGDADTTDHVRRPLIVPESMGILTLLEQFTETGIHFAAVVDEYGSLEGITTLSDILEELVGDVSPVAPGELPDVVREGQDRWQVAGGMHLDRLVEVLGLEGSVDLSDAPYQTVGGLVSDLLGRVPSVGDTFEWRGFEFSVRRMEGLRVERVRVWRRDGGAGS